MPWDESNTFESHAAHLTSIDDDLNLFAAQHGFTVEKNFRTEPCRILRKKGNPSYVIDLRQEGNWTQVRYRQDLPHTLSVTGYFVDQFSEYVYRITEEIAYFVHFGTIRTNLLEYLNTALECIEKWPAEVIFREGSQSEHPSVHWTGAAATGAHSMDLHELLFAIWQFHQAAKTIQTSGLSDPLALRSAIERIDQEISRIPESTVKNEFKKAMTHPKDLSQRMADGEFSQQDASQAVTLLYVWSGMFWHHASEISKSFPTSENEVVDVEPMHILLAYLRWPRNKRTPRAIMRQLEEEVCKLIKDHAPEDEQSEF